MKKAVIAIGAFILVSGAVIKLQSARDDLAAQRHAIAEAWTRVDAALQRRADALPDLMRTARKIAPGRGEAYAGIDEARKALNQAATPEDRIQANSRIDGAIGRILLALDTRGGDPSSQEYTRIQDELAGAENRIAVERRKYNEAVQKYNTSIELFPGNLAATIFGFTRSDAYFKTEPTGRRTPAVKK
jgi:LemA protein